MSRSGTGAVEQATPVKAKVAPIAKPAVVNRGGPAVGVLPPSRWTPQAVAGPDTTENTVLFQFRPGGETDLPRLLPLLRHYRVTPTPERIAGLYSARCAPADQRAILSLLAAQPSVLFAERMGFAQVADTTPNDPDFGNMWGLNGSNGILAPQAWDVERGSTKVTVAVLDTGGDYQHPDLYRNIWLNQGEIPAAVRGLLTDLDGDGLITLWDLNDDAANQGPGKITDLNGNGYIDAGDILQPYVAGGTGGWADGVSNDGDGYTDDLIGWNFTSNTNNPFDDHSTGHGTHVAGTVAATGNNGIGVVGVNWRAQIMPVKVLNSIGGGSAAQVASGVEYAYQHGARVASASIASPVGSLPATWSVIQTQIQNAANQPFPGQGTGMLYVAASGNNGLNTDSSPIFPASYPEANILSVANTNSNANRNSSSNYGAQSVDLGAPGTDIRSTLPNGGYSSKQGTSMAAPHVAGVAALLLAKKPSLSVTELKQTILSTVTPAASLAGQTVTGGILNAAAALATVAQSTMTFAPLGTAANARAFTPDSEVFPNSVGVETSTTISRALSATQLSDPITWTGVTTFDLGSAATNNATSGARTVALPAGRYTKLHYLATAGWGSYSNLTVRVNYADGTYTQPLLQSFSNWSATSTFPGETVVRTMDYRNVSDGTKNYTPVRVYGYTITLDSTKDVTSFVTPNHGKVFVLAVTLESGQAVPPPQPVNLAGLFNKASITPDGVAFAPANIGLENQATASNALSPTQLGLVGGTLTWNNVTFHVAAASTTTSNVIAGLKTVPLPTGGWNKLYLLATTAWSDFTDQTITIHYASGPSQTVLQSFRSWTSAATTNPRESVVKTMTARNLHTGASQSGSYRLYAYTIDLLTDRGQVVSVVTPNQGKVHVLAMTVAVAP